MLDKDSIYKVVVAMYIFRPFRIPARHSFFTLKNILKGKKLANDRK